MADQSALERLDRTESQLAIQHLASRYALALDGHDVDAIAALYVEDVKVGEPTPGVGREALKNWFCTNRGVARWYRSMHLIGAHVITFEDSDHAFGYLQCRSEAEVGDDWILTVVNYSDKYVRIDGEWLFRHRRPQPLYSCKINESPNDALGRLPTESDPPMRLPVEYPAFIDFWKQFPPERVAAVTRRPVG
jgi:ketosteroid isomerase-like protein